MKILFVCLGNICRSPTAEAVFRAVAAREAPELMIEVDSAGTAGYHIGEPPDLRTRQAAARRGYDMSPLRARIVEPRDFEDFDLILAMDRENLGVLHHRAPAHTRDRVRLFLSIKKLRTKAYANQKKRNRVSFPPCTQCLGGGERRNSDFFFLV